MKNFLDKAKHGSLLSAAVSFLLGLVLLIHPAVSFDILCAFVGVIFVAFSVYSIVIAVKSTAGFLFGAMLFADIAIGLFGLYLISAPNLIKSIIPIILGVIILIHSITEIRAALFMRDMGERYSWALALGVLTLLASVLILLHPFKTGDLMIRLVGAAFVYDGASSLWVLISFFKKQKKHNGAKTVDYKEF